MLAATSGNAACCIGRTVRLWELNEEMNAEQDDGAQDTGEWKDLHRALYRRQDAAQHARRWTGPRQNAGQDPRRTLAI